MQNSTKKRLILIFGYLSLFVVPAIVATIVGVTTKQKNYAISTLGLFVAIYLILFSIRVLRRQKETFSYSKLTEEEVKKAIEDGKYSPGIRFSQIMFFIAAITLLIACIICHYV